LYLQPGVKDPISIKLGAIEVASISFSIQARENYVRKDNRKAGSIFFDFETGAIIDQG